MAFALKPIDKEIQKVLDQKSKVFARDESALTTTGNFGNKKIKSRSCWMRWISGQQEPAVILGGLAYSDDNLEYTLAKGFKEVYLPPPNTEMKYQGKYTNPRTAKEISGKMKRGVHYKPLAGVKSVTTSFEGGINKSLQKVIVNWTVYDLEELNVLTPHFLSPGKYSILEMGWNYEGKQFVGLVGDKFFKAKQTAEDPAIENVDNLDDLGSLEDSMIDNKGDYVVVTGVISNFSYSVRDDGGFDCTTTMTTHGISLMDSTKDRATYTVDKALSNAKIDATVKEKQLQQDNITLAIERLATYFRIKITHKNNIPFKNDNGDYEFELWEGKEGRFFGDNPNTEKKKNWFMWGTLNKDNQLESDEPQHAWVRWGWFEDNIISKYVGYAEFIREKEGIDLGKIIGMGEVKLKFRSIDDVLTTTEDGIAIPQRKDPDKSDSKRLKESVRIISHKKILSTDVNKFILVGKTFSLEKDTKEFYQDLGDFLNENENILYKFEAPAPDKNPPDFEEGYIRNIYFNVAWLQDKFKGVGTLREGLDNVLNEFSTEYSNYFDLSIIGDDTEPSLARIIDKNNSRYNVNQFSISDIKNNNFSCYQFPTWTKDSIVSNMDYAVTIPSSQVAIAALSGGDLDISKIAQPNRGDINVQTYAKSLSKSFEDSKDRFFKNVSRIAEHSDVGGVSKFGLNDADENKPLGAGTGPGIVEALLERDESYGRDTKITDKGTFDRQRKGTDQEVTSMGSAHIFFDSPSAGTKGATNPKDYTSLYKNGIMQSAGSADYKSEMLSRMISNPAESKGVLTDLLNGIAELKLTIDGTGGIFPGSAFTSKHLPKHLLEPLKGTKNKDGTGGKLPLLFQITNVEHTLSPDGWKTTLTGQPRINHDHLYKKTSLGDGGRTTDDKSEIPTPLNLKNLDLLFKTKNLLGINSFYLQKHQMYRGIYKLIDDDYLQEGNNTKPYMTSAPYKSIGLSPVDELAWDYIYDKGPNKDNPTKNYYRHQIRCEPVVLTGNSIQANMRWAMYQAILYAMPDESMQNSVYYPYNSVDKSLQCASYHMFKSDIELKRWELDHGDGKTKYNYGSYSKPKLTNEYINQMIEDLKPFSHLSNGGGKHTSHGLTGLYTPVALLRRGIDIAGKFLKAPSKRQNTISAQWREAQKYQELFKFKHVGEFTEDITFALDNEVDIYNIKISEQSIPIWKDWFKCLYYSHLGKELDTILLTKYVNKEDGTREVQISDQFSSDGKSITKNTPKYYQIKEKFDTIFNNSFSSFHHEKEIDDFIDHMVKFGFHFIPELIWWQNLGGTSPTYVYNRTPSGKGISEKEEVKTIGGLSTTQSDDYKQEWFQKVIENQGTGGWDKKWENKSPNASYEVWPYEDRFKVGAQGNLGKRGEYYRYDKDGNIIN